MHLNYRNLLWWPKGRGRGSMKLPLCHMTQIQRTRSATNMVHYVTDETNRRAHSFINSLRLRNDLYCVEWHVKLYYTIPFTNSWFLFATNSTHSTNSFPNTISTGQSVNILILYHLNGELALDSQKKVMSRPFRSQSGWNKKLSWCWQTHAMRLEVNQGNKTQYHCIC